MPPAASQRPGPDPCGERRRIGVWGLHDEGAWGVTHNPFAGPSGGARVHLEDGAAGAGFSGPGLGEHTPNAGWSAPNGRCNCAARPSAASEQGLKEQREVGCPSPSSPPECRCGASIASLQRCADLRRPANLPDGGGATPRHHGVRRARKRDRSEHASTRRPGGHPSSTRPGPPPVVLEIPATQILPDRGSVLKALGVPGDREVPPPVQEVLASAAGLFQKTAVPRGRWRSSRPKPSHRSMPANG
jgi:hypothetical protein